MNSDFAKWNELAEEVITGMKEWRLQHPKATLREIERALDEELELLPGTLTPNLQEDLVHLGTWMPFGRAVKELQHFRGVDVSRPTAERSTEAAGAAYVAWQTVEVERLEKELPSPPAGPERQFLSVDGAMVPLVGGNWAEVKTLALGEALPPVEIKGDG